MRLPSLNRVVVLSEESRLGQNPTLHANQSAKNYKKPIGHGRQRVQWECSMDGAGVLKRLASGATRHGHASTGDLLLPCCYIPDNFLVLPLAWLY